MPDLRDPLAQRNNNFDLLRLGAALLVLWFHQHLLLGVPSWPNLPFLPVVPPDDNVGILGVFVFFAISGYLNTLSLLHSRSIFIFLSSRSLRIYPALLVCVAFSVFLGVFFSDHHAYFTEQLASYWIKNSLLFFGYRTEVHGVFEANPIPRVINGSLWTLPYEVKLYVVFAFALAASRFSRLAPVVFFMGTAIVFAFHGHGSDANWWLRFSIIFFAGSATAAVQLQYGLPIAILTILAIGALTMLTGDQGFAYGTLITALTIVAANLNVPAILRPPVDLSYGIYLYGYPVQQAIVAYTNKFWISLVLSLAATIALAAISWKFIERPAIALKTLIKKTSASTVETEWC